MNTQIKSNTENVDVNTELNKNSNFKIITGILIIFSLIIGGVNAADWAMFHHDLEHTGETSDVIQNPENLELKWKFKTGIDALSKELIKDLSKSFHDLNIKK